MTINKDTEVPERIWLGRNGLGNVGHQGQGQGWYSTAPYPGTIEYARVDLPTQEPTSDEIWVNRSAGFVANHKAGSAFELYRRVDTPAAPTPQLFAAGWQTCGVTPDDSRMVRMKFETSEAASDFVDRMAGLNIPAAPAAPDERVRAVAGQFFARWMNEPNLDHLEALCVSVNALLATVCKETWEKAINSVPQVGVTFPDGYEEWITAPEYRGHVITALESASKE